MTGASTRRWSADGLPSERQLWFGLLCALELLALVGYFRFTTAELTSVRYALYPFVWVNVGLLAVAGTRTAHASRRQRVFAGGIAAGYFGVLAWLVGMVGLHLDGQVHASLGFDVAMPSPGWGPLVTYVTPAVHFVFVPFRVIGYLALAYLVYAAVLESLTVPAGGLLALVSCVSCAFPLISSLAAGLTGSTAGLATVYAYSVDASTLVFVVAVALLYWRPGGSNRVGS
jgi:hypothetical protein